MQMKYEHLHHVLYKTAWFPGDIVSLHHLSDDSSIVGYGNTNFFSKNSHA